jgi:hypothetical protein
MLQAAHRSGYVQGWSSPPPVARESAQDYSNVQLESRIFLRGNFFGAA